MSGMILWDAMGRRQCAEGRFRPNWKCDEDKEGNTLEVGLRWVLVLSEK